jgi:CheY-like chemotaxis protein
MPERQRGRETMAKKILLADDSITIQKVVELTFAEGDYEVVCASDGAQAIRKIDEIVPDIALVDVMMPQRNGYEVCAHVKKDPSLAWIPVLLLTGTFEPYDPKRSEEVGAD